MAGNEHYTRRTFLATCGAAWAGSVLAQVAEPSGSTAPGVRFGVRAPFSTASIRDRALLLQRLGYEGVELGPEMLNQAVDSIKEQLEGTGIVISSIVGSIKLIDPDLQVRAQAVEVDRSRLVMAKALGASAVIEVPAFGPTRFQDLSPIMTPREIEERLLVNQLKTLAADIQRTGITLLIEPLTKMETHFINLQSQGAGIIEEVGSAGVRLLSDFYHMQMEEKDIGETLARYGKYTAYVHLADGQARTEPGSLPFDYRPGFGALKKWGYNGWLVVESKATDNPEAALGRALEYLKRQWSEA
jgi:sugar phosphate isomerase/epimerase